MRNKADYDIASSRHGTQQVAMDATVQAQEAQRHVDSVVSVIVLKSAHDAIKEKIKLQLLSGMSVISDL